MSSSSSVQKPIAPDLGKQPFYSRKQGSRIPLLCHTTTMCFLTQKSLYCYAIFFSLSPTEGYLDKLKHKVSFFGSWNKRYFRMNIAGERLEYFASEKAVEKGEVKGHITLANLKAVKKFDDVTFQIDGEFIYHLPPHDHDDYVFFIPSIHKS